MTTSRHPSLEDAFAPPKGRGEGLADLLAPRPRATSPRPEKPADATRQPAAGPAAPGQRGRRLERAARTATAATEPSVKNVAIYLPPETLAAARAASRHRDITYAELLADAFADVDVDTLTARFTAKASAGEEEGMPRRPARTSGAAGIQRQFRLTTEQVEWLDAQVRIFKAPSRSALAAAVLGLYLGTVTE
jgi:hypothetical protein